MKRPGIVRRLVGLLVGTALILSLAAPARAQFDPITLSLIMGGLQLVTGVVAAIGLGVSQDTKQQNIGTPWGTPCGQVDGVPQICWQPHAGGFEGSPDLPTGAKPYSSAPQPPRPSPSVELQLEIQPLESETKAPAPGQ
jgi:hypothetical protein